MAGSQDRRQLHFQEFADLQAQPDGPQTHGGIWAGLEMTTQRTGELVAADVECADGDGTAIHTFNQTAVGEILFLLARQLVAVHIEELGAQQPNAAGACLKRAFVFDR